MIPASDGESGFTLVEILVSMAVLSLIAIFSLEALSVLSVARQSAHRLARSDEIEAVLQFINDRLATALPRDSSLDIQKQGNFFSGTSNSVKFIALVNDPRMAAGMQDIRISLDESKLILAAGLSDSKVIQVPRYLMLDNVTKLVLTYDGQNRWNSADKLPRTIEVELGTMEPDGSEMVRKRSVSLVYK